MPRALCLLRSDLHYRRDAFCAGLAAVGFDVVPELSKPAAGDLLVIWNRYGRFHLDAQRFEAAGARVVVAENGPLGKAWRGGNWYSLALGHHSGPWAVGGPERWDAFGVELAPWRDGFETVILGQRGIGEPGIASPHGWAEDVRHRLGGRIRPHPGSESDGAPLEADLANARCVLTWHSGAALKALLFGVPAFHDFPRWVGAGAARPLSEFHHGPRTDDARLAMFRRLAWLMWDLEEIRSGRAFRHLLGR